MSFIQTGDKWGNISKQTDGKYLIYLILKVILKQRKRGWKNSMQTFYILTKQQKTQQEEMGGKGRKGKYNRSIVYNEGNRWESKDVIYKVKQEQGGLKPL